MYKNILIEKTSMGNKYKTKMKKKKNYKQEKKRKSECNEKRGEETAGKTREGLVMGGFLYISLTTQSKPSRLCA